MNSDKVIVSRYNMSVSEDDTKLLEAFHSLTVKPKVETTEDLLSFIKHMGKELEKEDAASKGAIPKASSTHHYPRISTFYGEENKGEVSWPTFKFEVEALMAENIFSKEQILLGIRRAIKGSASDVLRRLGIGVDIKVVMEKLQSTFGSIESEETILRKFYACQQESSESVTAYAARIEEILERAVALGGMKKDSDKILKRVFYQGLKPTIKHMAFSKCDTIEDYDRFKIEVRKIEADLEIPLKEEKKKCNAMINTEKREKSEMTEVKELLHKLNDRIDRLEKCKDDATNKYPSTGNFNMSTRGYRPYRGGYRGRGMTRGRGESGNGRGDYRPMRPTGSNIMQPTCYSCGLKGHIARNCPNW